MSAAAEEIDEDQLSDYDLDLFTSAIKDFKHGYTLNGEVLTPDPANEAEESEIVDYIAEPTAAKFHASTSRVRGIRGPIGSGKTVACVVEALYGKAYGQLAYRKKRKSRWGVVRNTYPELLSTTIKTFIDWVPQSQCKWRMTAPIRCLVTAPLPDGTTVEAEFLFVAIDRPDQVKKLKSLELTGGLLNEASELHKSVLDMMGGRIGRYPSIKDGGFNWTGIIMDTNPPADDHWWYEDAEVTKPEGFEYFNQPPAVLGSRNEDYRINPAAENIRNHVMGARYYLDQVPGKTHEWIAVFLKGEYGDLSDGMPVYSQFDQFRHISEEPLAIYRGLPILLGWDFGRTPACIVCQLTLTGQFRVLREIVATASRGIRINGKKIADVNGTSITPFAKKYVKPYLALNFSGMKILSWGDPSGADAGDKDESTCIQRLNDLDIITVPTRSNSRQARQDPLVELLISTSEGQPSFIVDKRCDMVRRGFGGKFKYRRVQVPGEDNMYSEKPVKNEWSHPCEAAEYVVQGVSDDGMATGSEDSMVPAPQRDARIL